VIYGSGTQFPDVEVNSKVYSPGQVNNIYIFPGTSFGAVMCKATTIPERLFMVAAEAVANTIDDDDMKVDRCLPRRERLRETNLNVAAAVVFEAQKLKIAGEVLGNNLQEVKSALEKMMWTPDLAK